MAPPKASEWHVMKGRIMKSRLTVASCIVAVLALHSGFLHADDAPASKSAPATTAPTDAAVGDDVIRSAKSFFAVLRDGNADKAHERTSADDRKEHTADEFKQTIDSFRSAPRFRTPSPSTASMAAARMHPRRSGRSSSTTRRR
jgi:hypothetical protein